jgi:hypothetical protein
VKNEGHGGEEFVELGIGQRRTSRPGNQLLSFSSVFPYICLEFR